MRVIQFASALLVCCFLVIPLSAEMSFDEFAKQYKAEFQQFREARDREFHDFLKQTWEEFRVFKGQAEDPEPKPKTIPAPPPPRKVVKPTPIPVVTKPVERVTPKPRPLAVPTPPTPPTSPAAKTIRIAFLGSPLAFQLSRDWQRLTLTSVSGDGVAAFWADFANLDTQPVIAAMQQYRRQFALNDWGYLLMARHLGDHLYQDRNLAELVTWGLLLKSGFDARVGYYQQKVFLLFRPEQALFEIPYFNLAGKRYYLGTPHDGSDIRLHTYTANYPGASETLDLLVHNMPKLGASDTSRTLTFTFDGRDYRIRVPINKALIEFLATVPQMELRNYFVARPDASLGRALIEPLRAAVRSMSPDQAVDFLLRFVQTSLKYQTDDQQFGQENYLFIEETLYYPAADCEDRTILFTWLVREVLGLEAVALDYPGHVAAAVRVPNVAKGLYVEVGGQRFEVADPTYINASMGRVVPPYDQKKPKIIATRYQ